MYTSLYTGLGQRFDWHVYMWMYMCAWQMVLTCACNDFEHLSILCVGVYTCVYIHDGMVYIYMYLSWETGMTPWWFFLFNAHPQLFLQDKRMEVADATLMEVCHCIHTTTQSYSCTSVCMGCTVYFQFTTKYESRARNSKWWLFKAQDLMMTWCELHCTCTYMCI